MRLSVSGHKATGLLTVLALATGTVLAAGPSASAHSSSPALVGQRVGFFTQWSIYSGFSAKKVDTSGQAAKLTTLNYAFGNVGSDGTCFEANQAGQGDAWADYQRPVGADEAVDGVADTADQPLKGNFNQLRELKAKYPQLHPMITLGGWTWSAYFSSAAATPESRAKLVSSCIDQFIKGDLPVLDGVNGGQGAAANIFDGIDIDWEYPGGGGNDGNQASPQDGHNFTLLLQEFRKQLDALGKQTGKHYLLTADTAAGRPKIAQLELPQAAKAVDWFNLMAYDFHGSWEATGPTNDAANLHQAPNDPAKAGDLNYSIDGVLGDYLSHGVPAKKIVLGTPFYGYGWSGVGAKNNGLYQPATGTLGSIPYNTLVNTPGTLHYNWVTGASTKYDAATQSFYSYDTPQVLESKAAYSRWLGLGGVMAWSLDNDTATGDLMSALNKGLNTGF
ncbi:MULTISPECIES: glycoside hydrolase family 18 protein [Streptacidiphilus]|uniref:chitinase n=1 Tax=Streptacidiphilus cavernicola TaxID=3342716 RepID=A0ABV6ULI3_9ACTN|nr:glycoside hydrolase family 18 protein [Streptacidiphilus jeojiense]